MPAGSVGEAVTVSLWHLPADRDERRRLCARHAGILSGDERGAVARAGRPALAERLLSSRVLLRLALAGHLGCAPEGLRFERPASGRLALSVPADTGLSFNLSHAAGESVVAVSPDGVVGVDIETTRRAETALRVARSFFPAAETEAIERGSRPALCALIHWTLKESLVKALGGTIWAGLEQYQFAVTTDAVTLSGGSSLDPAAWRFAVAPHRGDYTLAVALGLPPGDGRNMELCFRRPT